MKKIVTVTGIALIILSACSSASEAKLGRLKTLGTDRTDGSVITIIEDSKTGCQYMNIDAGYGQVIQPLLTKDGTPYCGEETDK